MTTTMTTKKSPKKWIFWAILIALFALLVLLPIRIKRPKNTNSAPAPENGTAQDTINGNTANNSATPAPTDIPTGTPQYIADIGDAINAFTDKIIDFTARYKGNAIDYWVNQIVYLNPDAVLQLDNYWNAKYFQSNGAYSVGLLVFDIELGGERSLIYAIEKALTCGIQGFSCALKELALTNLKSVITS